VHLNKPWDSVQLLKLVLILRTYGTTPPKVGVDTRLYFCRPVWLVRLGTVAMAIAQWPKPTGQPRLYRDAAAAGPPRAGPGPPPLPRHVKRAACVDRCAQAETAELYDVYNTVRWPVSTFSVTLVRAEYGRMGTDWRFMTCLVHRIWSVKFTIVVL
jgi:hypothetical protein